MNYVAHLFLSEPTTERRIGSLLADFTVGTIDDMKKRFGLEIATGIKHHRQIDKFTDSHPSVTNSVDLLRSGYGPYAGIIVDVLYDHYLLKYWNAYSRESEDLFFDSVYRSLDCWDWEFPERYRTAVERMLEKRWLNIYIELEKVGYALSRIGERFPRETPLGNALVGIRANYGELESDFQDFFPSLMEFSKTVDCRL